MVELVQGMPAVGALAAVAAQVGEVVQVARAGDHFDEPVVTPALFVDGQGEVGLNA
jgi:hypothetical protein